MCEMLGGCLEICLRLRTDGLIRIFPQGIGEIRSLSCEQHDSESEKCRIHSLSYPRNPLGAYTYGREGPHHREVLRGKQGQDFPCHGSRNLSQCHEKRAA